MTTWDEFTPEHKDALAGALLEAWTAYERRDRTKSIGPTIIAPLFDAIVKVADERLPKPTIWGFDPGSPDGDSSVEVRVGPGGTIRGWRTAMPDPDAFNDVKRGEFRRIEEVVASLAEHVQAGDNDVDRNLKAAFTRIEELEAQVLTRCNALYQITEKIRTEADRQRQRLNEHMRSNIDRSGWIRGRLEAIEDAFPSIRDLVERAVDITEQNSQRLSVIEGTVDVGIAELSSRIDGLTPPRLRGIADAHKPASAIKCYFGDDATFGKLPIELRKRWWKETDYGGNAPSDDLKRTVNAVLPGHFPDVPTIIDQDTGAPAIVRAVTMPPAVQADADALDPEPDPLDTAAEAPFSAFDGEDNLKGRVDPLIQKARDATRAAYEAHVDSEPDAMAQARAHVERTSVDEEGPAHPELHRARRDSED